MTKLCSESEEIIRRWSSEARAKMWKEIIYVDGILYERRLLKKKNWQ
jgi:hypothetical protein